MTTLTTLTPRRAAGRIGAARTLRTLLLSLAVTLAGAGGAAAEAVKYTIDPAHTFPMFELSHLGFSQHRGRFNSSRGTLLLDREGRTGAVEITVDANSIDTGHEALEKVLRSEDFFAVEKFPQLHFRSTRLQFDGDRLVGVDGELTLHGETRPLQLTVDFFHCGRRILQPGVVCGANARGKLKRSEFGISKYIPLGLGDEVTITIQVEAIAPPAATE